uniref:ATP synthase complex subunit 8 n=1 Tax=Urogymnus dalyensis TaxID=3031783 RepID=A0A0K0LDM8_9CHON|nr:ATP synthase F0 subunit 8 [Urogymnus dalyensis]AIY56263.1 ATP synthase F0 subunit 8 [Urogymnus dalyensis]
MPQLNPNPWFMIFLFAWTFFLLLMPGKIMSYMFNNCPTTKNTQKPKSTPWNWPWA